MGRPVLFFLLHSLLAVHVCIDFGDYELILEAISTSSKMTSFLTLRKSIRFDWFKGLQCALKARIVCAG